MPKNPVSVSLVFPLFALGLAACTPVDEEPLDDPKPGFGETTSDETAVDDFDAEVGLVPGADPEEPGWQDLDFKSRPSICGDKLAELPETCDDGDANGEHADCTPLCRVASCGDGFVHVSEECDNGLANDNNAEGYGSCSASCKLIEGCGDGVVQEDYEQCDHGFDGSMQCSPKCEWFGRIVFVTEGAYKGDLGGIEGADQKCQDEAYFAGYPAPDLFRAWLSTAGSGVAWLDADDGRKFVRPDGETVALTLEDLTDGTIGVPISVTATKTTPAVTKVWSDTDVHGNSASSVDCGGWTETAGQGRVGLNNATDSTWTLRDNAAWCTSSAHLYCFEQPDVGIEPPP